MDMRSLTYCDDVTAWPITNLVVGKNLYTIRDLTVHRT